LEKTADQLRAQMADLPFMGNVATTTAMQRPEILITPRLDIAAEQGVSVTSIGQVAKIATLGDIDTNVAKFNLPDRQVPIRVQLDPKWRGDMGIISTLRVRNFNGDLLPLTSVADISLGSSSATIDRFDRARKVAVEGDLHGKELGDAMKIINELPALKNLPSGISRPSYGASEQMQIMFVGFVVALITGILLNLAILTLLFRRPVRGAHGAVPAGPDRHHHADGHRHQKLDPAGRIRDHGAA
jgi:multidrug efflux pump subunit AcrB